MCPCVVQFCSSTSTPGKTVNLLVSALFKLLTPHGKQPKLLFWLLPVQVAAEHVLHRFSIDEHNSQQSAVV